MKNILLCCNSMGIGGVETVILNQVIAFSKRGYNVFVIAKKGEYSNNVEKNGGHFIEVDFPEENCINIDRAKTIIKIIKEKKITEIHIHKYQCIPSVLVAAFAMNVPYFAYEHGIKDTKKYYTWNYPIYKSLFPIYYENAYKIIAITPKVAEITKKEYGFKNDKYAIVHNGIDFNSFKNENPNYNNKVENILIISRLDREKLPTIFNGIKAYKIIKEIYPNIKLNIVGSGNAEKDIKDYLSNEKLEYTFKDNNVPVKFWGKQTDVKNYLIKNDILIGVGRCILEAIAMKVPAIITGYNGINGLVTKNNLKDAMEENFSGINLETISDTELKNQIQNLINNKKEVIDRVYEMSVKELDCHKNYINIPEEEKLNIDWFDIFKKIEESSHIIEKQSKDLKEQYEWIKKIEEQNNELISEKKELIKQNDKKTEQIQQNKEMLEKIKKIIKDKDNEINSKIIEIEEIYNSKRWKYVEKIIKILGKKKKAKRK